MPMLTAKRSEGPHMSRSIGTDCCRGGTELRRFAVEARQLVFSFGGIGESQCLDLSERMLAAAQRCSCRRTLEDSPQWDAG